MLPNFLFPIFFSGRGVFISLNYAKVQGCQLSFNPEEPKEPKENEKVSLLVRIFFLCLCASSPLTWGAPLAPGANPTSSSLQIWEDLTHLEKKPISTLKKKTTRADRWLGKPVTLQGWLIPNEFESQTLTQFILARYPLGCIHVPLPSPENLILVRILPETSGPSHAITQTTRVSVQGILKKSGRVDAEYEIEAKSWNTD